MAEIHWSRMKASEINALAKRDTVVIVPVASTEQHGPHLPTQVDCLLVGAIAERAARARAGFDTGDRHSNCLERSRRASHEPRSNAVLGLSSLLRTSAWGLPLSRA